MPVEELFIEHDILHRKTPKGTIQIIVPQSLVPPTLQLVHDSPIAGHPGRDKCLTEVRRKYHWPPMSRDICEHVSQCATCARFRGSAAGEQPMLDVPIPAEPCDTTGIDEKQQWLQYLLVAVGLFTRYTVLVPLKDKAAKYIARVLIVSVFCTFNVP